MKKQLIIFLLIAIVMQNQAQVLKTSSRIENPFFKEWATPYQTPPFSKIKPEHYYPGFEFAIKEARKDLETIKNNPETPTFENTIVALDRAGAMLNRIAGVFFNILECDATPEMEKIAGQVQPMVTSYSNSVYLDTALFKRVEYVYTHEFGKLEGAQKMLLKNTYDAFINHGANLPDEMKQVFNDVSIRLSNLSLSFSQNALAATNAYTMHITKKKDLAGIPEADLNIAAQKAKDKGLTGWIFDLSYPSTSAILTYADNRELREEIFMHSCCKAFKGEFDNSQNIIDILTCRYQLSQLMGYKNYAEYALHDRMAENIENVYNLLNELKEYSYPAAQKEMASLTEFAHSLGFQGELQRWDYAYYAEKQQKSLFNLSTEELKPYFKLENVIDGVFNLASTLYQLKFVPNKSIDVYHPDVTVYEVYRENKLMAILYLDFHPRATKRSGAWMTSFREQYIDQSGNDVRPLVSLVMNFTPSTDDHPSLLTFDEVTTFLHEFGHALNGMLSEVPYQSISGANSPRDFVELPSQLNENWATETAFLNTFAKHYQTGENIPASYIEQLKNMRRYMAGYSSTRQLSFGYLDMMWHTTPPEEITDIYSMERKVFDELEVMPVVTSACMSPSFSHIFAGGYAAGYYGYKWAEMLEADAFTRFQEEGVMNTKVANQYRENILSRGGSIPAMEMFMNFVGHKPSPDALLKRDGLK